MKVQLHPDGVVFVRDGDGIVIYSGSVAEFEAEGGTLPAMPEGTVSFIYCTDTQIMVFTDAKGNAFPMEGRVHVPECVAAVAVADVLVTKMVARQEAKREVLAKAQKAAKQKQIPLVEAK